MNRTLAPHCDTDEVIRRWDANVGDRAADIDGGTDTAYPLLLEHVLMTLDTTPSTSASRVLDVGCGLGYATRALRMHGFDTTGIDPSARSVNAALSAFGTGFTVEEASSHLARVGRSAYDVVTLIMVLHCMPRYEETLRACKSLLRKRGVVCIVLPHPSRYLQQKSYFASLEFDYFRETCFEIPFKVAGGRVHQAPVLYFHRPLSHYTNVISDLGMRLELMVEPSEDETGRLNDIVTLVVKKPE